MEITLGIMATIAIVAFIGALRSEVKSKRKSRKRVRSK